MHHIHTHVPGQQTAKVSVLWQKYIGGHCLIAEQVTRPAEVDRGVPSPPQGSIAEVKDSTVGLYFHQTDERESKKERERETHTQLKWYLGVNGCM